MIELIVVSLNLIVLLYVLYKIYLLHKTLHHLFNELSSIQIEIKEILTELHNYNSEVIKATLDRIEQALTVQTKAVYRLLNQNQKSEKTVKFTKEDLDEILKRKIS